MIHEQDFKHSSDPYVYAWQEKTVREADRTKRRVKGVMALGAATAALATGIGFSEGKVQQTLATDLAATGALMGIGKLSNRKHEEIMEQVRKAGDPNHRH